MTGTEPDARERESVCRCGCSSWRWARYGELILAWCASCGAAPSDADAVRTALADDLAGSL